MDILNLRTFTWTKNELMQFTGCCENMALAAGEDSPAAMIEKSDCDLIWRDRESIYLPGEKSALKGQIYKKLDFVTTSMGLLRIATVKSPLYDKNQTIIGIVGCSIDITNKSFVHYQGQLDGKGILYLGEFFANEYLTKQEIKILKWLLHGYTSKKIAVTLAISYRTVEGYIQNIKMKLQCKTKGELIELLVKTGLFYLLLNN